MLKGKTALVTGSTSGIGLSIARALANDGANLMLNGFGDKAAIEKERSGIEKEFGVKARYSAADMSKPADIAEMIAAAEKEFGSLDVLVNNAGIQHVANVEDFPIEKWDAIIAINLSSSLPHNPRRAAGHEAAQMGTDHQYRVGAWAGRQRREGRLRRRQARPRRIDQGGGDRGRERWHHLQRDLSRLGADPVGAAAGGCAGQAAGYQPSTRRRSALLSEKQPMHEFTKPENIGALAVFLASDAAATITGSAYSIDGGWVAQ